MPRGVSLSSDERTVILSLNRENKSSQHIEFVTARGRDAVLAKISSGQVRVGQRSRGLHRTVLLIEVRLILHLACTRGYTVVYLGDRCVPVVSIRRVKQLILSIPHLHWECVTCAPTLTSAHRVAPVGWSRKILVKGSRFWRRVIFEIDFL